ncbi:MAG: prefoldin subunit alpha [Candidatus Aenigmarchaeota archaeon]|nr:prefoldin subunit alpha [Candidatus Aenigmarchaeota archaeon]
MEKELQRKYLQLQLMKQQMNALLEEKIMLNERITELVSTIDAVKKLEHVRKGQEIWSPLGSAAFLDSDVKDTSKILIGVGAGVILKKTREDAIAILQSRLDEIDAIDKELITEINKYNNQLSVLEPEVQRLAEAEQAKESRK